MRRCRGEGDEAGAVLVIWVVALVGIMAFTAMAFDLGNVAQTKERAVTAAQDAVLAGVGSLSQLYSAGGGIASEQEADAVNLAEQYLEDNFSGVTASDFASTSCQGLLPSGLYAWSGGVDTSGSPVAASDCFGFFDPSDSTKNQSNPYAMAVALPPRVVNYTFGRAAGVTHQNVSAAAYASLERAIGSSGGFPFSYTLGGGVGLQCLKTKSNSGNTTCSGFTTGSGNFGMILSSRYLVFPGVVTGGGNDATMETDMVLGIDHTLHILGSSPAGSTPVCDAATPPSNVTPACNGTDPATGTSYNGVAPAYWDWANYVMPQTGNALTDLTNPLFTGGVTPVGVTCTLDPLLSHPDGFQPQEGGPAAPCAPDNNQGTASGPYLLSGDTFGYSAQPLNGVSIAKFLNSNWQTYDASAAGSNCAALEPGGSTGYSTYPLDEPSNSGGYEWASFDTCLSQEIANMVQPYTTPPSGDPSLATVPPADQIFKQSIEQSPRFGQVPIVAGSNGSNPQEIIGFADVYLDMAFSGGNKVASLAAWVFPQSMIENGTVASSIGGDGYNGGAYVPYLCAYGVTC